MVCALSAAAIGSQGTTSVEATDALIKFLQRTGVLAGEVDPEVVNNLHERPILALSHRKIINESDAFRALKKHLGIDYIDLEDPLI
jgi:hypothetical protein